MNNCTVTIYDNGESHDADSGYRKAGTQKHVLKDAPALLSPAKARRVLNSDGLKQYSKPTFGLLIEDIECEITIGMLADVTQDGETLRYTVSEALPVPGFLTSDWQLEIERLKT